MVPADLNSFKPLLTSERLCITVGGDGMKIAGGTGETTNVVIADIQVDNGVIHVVDKVFLPRNHPACH